MSTSHVNFPAEATPTSGEATTVGFTPAPLVTKSAFAGDSFLPAEPNTIEETGLTLPEILSGAVITETIFQWPGMGLLVMRAVSARDYPLIMGTILVTAGMVLICNLVADLLYAVADPRIRLSQGRG